MRLFSKWELLATSVTSASVAFFAGSFFSTRDNNQKPESSQKSEDTSKANSQPYNRTEIGITCEQGIKNAEDFARYSCGGFWGGVNSTKFSCTPTTGSSVTVNGWYKCNR